MNKKTNEVIVNRRVEGLDMGGRARACAEQSEVPAHIPTSLPFKVDIPKEPMIETVPNGL
jgi:hypothetical protein